MEPDPERDGNLQMNKCRKDFNEMTALCEKLHYRHKMDCLIIAVKAYSICQRIAYDDDLH